MNAQIIQQPGPTWILQVEIPAYSQQELTALFSQGMKAATTSLVQERLEELACVTVAQAAEALHIKTVETVRGYGKLPEKHPRYLPIIWGETALSDKVMLADLKAWQARNKRKDTLQKIARFDAKNA